MKKITAKFSSKCAETGARIRKGETMYYDYSVRKCYAMSSETAKKAEQSSEANREADSTRSYIDAQENAYFDNFSRNL